MVSSENLIPLVDRLLKQLQEAATSSGDADNPRSIPFHVEPLTVSDAEDIEVIAKPSHELYDEQDLPAEYKLSIIHQILNICSKDTYANISDFEWYVETLIRLAKIAPRGNTPLPNDITWVPSDQNIYSRIGQELRELAVRVSSVRAESVNAADSLLRFSRSSRPASLSPVGDAVILGSAAWVVGEYVEYCVDAHNSLESLLNPSLDSFSPDVICAYLQAVPKVFARIVTQPYPSWNAERRTMLSLLAARIITFLEPFTNNSDVDVQERAVQFLELIRLGSQTVTTQDPELDQEPIFLTKVLPQLFWESKLNPVAPTAQRKVPSVPGLDLTIPINTNLHHVLRCADETRSPGSDVVEFESFYKQPPSQSAARETVSSTQFAFLSYQQSEESATDTDTILRRRLERRERQKDDPFYIGEAASSGFSTPFHDILRDSNGESVDVDSIPIMELKAGLQLTSPRFKPEKQKKRRPKKVDVIQDITIGSGDSDSRENAGADTLWTAQRHASAEKKKKKTSLLEVDATGLTGFTLNAIGEPSDPNEPVTNKREDFEMVEAMAEVEKLRLEMQRASERVQAADGAPAEGTLVKMKKRKQTKRVSKMKDGRETPQKPSVKDEHNAGRIKKKKKRSISPVKLKSKLVRHDDL